MGRKAELVVARLEQQHLVPRELLETLIMDLESVRACRILLVWQAEQVQARLVREHDREELVRWQAKWEILMDTKKLLDEIVDELIREEVVDA